MIVNFLATHPPCYIFSECHLYQAHLLLSASLPPLVQATEEDTLVAARSPALATWSLSSTGQPQPYIMLVHRVEGSLVVN